MSILSAIGNTPLVELEKGKIILQPVSGNTGIALAIERRDYVNYS